MPSLRHTTPCGAISLAARLEVLSSRTRYFSSVDSRGRSQNRILPPSSRIHQQPRCSPATSRRLPHPRATRRGGRHSVFGRYFESRLNQPTDYDGKNPLTMSNGTLIFRVYSLVLGDTYLIGNGTVSNFRGTLNRSKIPKLTPTLFDFNDLGIKG